MSKQLGVSPKTQLDMKDPNVVEGLMRGIITMENGGNPYSHEELSHAANLAVAHLPSTGSILSAASGNPTAQLQIAKNSVAYTNAGQDLNMVSKLDGENQQRMQQAVDAKQALLAPTGDPAGYLYSHNMFLTQTVQDGLKHPAAMLEAIKTADNVYNSIGQDPNNRPVLSKELSQGLVSKITASGPSQGLQALEQLKQQQGASFGRIYTDLQRQGNLPIQYSMAMMMPNPMDRSQLMRSYTEDPEDAKKPGVDLAVKNLRGVGTIKSSMDSLVDNDSVLHKFISTYSMQGGDTPQTAFTGVIKRLAYEKYRQGSGIQEAADNASKAITDNYDMTLGSSRIPNNIAPAVKRNASAMLASLDSDTVAVPRYATEANAYARSLKNNSTWVNNNDDTGLNLLDNMGYAVRDKRGLPTNRVPGLEVTPPL